MVFGTGATDFSNVETISLPVSTTLILVFSKLISPLTGVVSCFCPCITYGNHRARIDALNDNGQVLHEPSAVNNDCLVFGGLSCFTGIGGAVLAVRIFPANISYTLLIPSLAIQPWQRPCPLWSAGRYPHRCRFGNLLWTMCYDTGGTRNRIGGTVIAPGQRKWLPEVDIHSLL